MTQKSLITHERLLELVEYDRATGMFYWRVSGKVAGFNRDMGYRLIMLDRKKYPAQRVAWFYVHGEWPERILRFKNGDGQDCRIENLTYGEFHYAKREGRNAYDRAARERNPERFRWHQIKRDFGLTREQYEAMLVAQGGVCACCGKSETSTYRGRVRALAVDHNHDTGAVRGLVCNGCNLMIGHSRENVQTLRLTASYLEQHAADPSSNVVPLVARKESA